jgi:hypothetical protein
MKMWQHIYEMKTHNFLFDFIPKDLLYIKNNNRKYELGLTAALGKLYMLDSNM